MTVTDKILAVTGATGGQGGGVVNIMKAVPGWKIRAVTRNVGSDAAKKLAADGHEVVTADFNDEASLIKAFEGAAAVFGNTNWWEALFQGKSQWEAGEIEEQQGMNIAHAAAKTSTLEHYIWSTQPSPKARSNGEIEAPHQDYKARVDARIKKELPELARKTTYISLGYYPQNLAFFPCLKPAQWPMTDVYVQMVATKPDALVLLAGDVTVNPGLWVRGILSSGKKAFEKYSNVALERWTFQRMIETWSAVTGKKGIFVQCSEQTYTDLWGPVGKELAWQFKFGESCDSWEPSKWPGEYITAKELGIDEAEVVGCKDTLKRLHSQGLLV